MKNAIRYYIITTIITSNNKSNKKYINQCCKTQKQQVAYKM